MNDLSNLEEQIKLFNEIEPQDLARKDLATFGFSDSYSTIEKIYSMLAFFIENRDVLREDFTQANINVVEGKIKEYIELAKNIKEFSPTDIPNPNDIRKNLSDRISNLHKSILESLMQVRTALELRRLNKESALEDLNLQKSQMAKALKDIDAKNKEADDILDKIKQASGSAGATLYSNVFGDQAGKHKTSSRNWLTAAVFVFAVIVIYIIILLVQSPVDSTNVYLIVQKSFIKVLFLSTLLYALYQCVRNYNANKHLQTINQHRQNAIEIFETFALASPTPEVKSAILMQATKSIFEHSKSGYLLKDESAGTSFNIIDFFHKVSSNKG